MGQSTSMYNRQGGFNIYHYPYSMKQKVLQFPYRHHFYYANTPTLALMFFAFSAPMFWYMQGKMGSPEMKKAYREYHQHQYDHPHYQWTIRPLRPDYSEIDLTQFDGKKRWRGD